MKKIIYYIIFSLIALILQVQLTLYFPNINPMPDFLLIVVIFVAFFSGAKTGFILGLIIGIIQDIFIGEAFAIYTISKAVLGAITGSISGRVYKKNVLIPPIIVFFFSILQEILIVPFSNKLLFNFDLWQLLKDYIFKFSLYNSFVALISYFLIYLIYLNRSNYYE